MKSKKLLLTGGTGTLGHAIINSGCFPDLLAPSRDALDVTDESSVSNFFKKNEIITIIHCAAAARMLECETNPANAISTNMIGACNLVKEVLRIKKEENRDIRFIYISTDGVYPGAKGRYSEKDGALPYNKYGWTKLGGECAVNLLKNFCIIRTSFFDPDNIRFDESAGDAYSSKMPVKNLAQAVCLLSGSSFVGTINVGDERKSEYDRYRKFKPSIARCRLKDILKQVPFTLVKDASLDTKLWKKVSRAKK